MNPKLEVFAVELGHLNAATLKDFVDFIRSGESTDNVMADWAGGQFYIPPTSWRPTAAADVAAAPTQQTSPNGGEPAPTEAPAEEAPAPEAPPVPEEPAA